MQSINKIIFITILITLCILGCDNDNSNKLAEEKYIQGLIHLKNEAYKQAAKSFSEAVIYDSTNANYLYHKALSNYKYVVYVLPIHDSNFYAVINDFNKALNLSKNNDTLQANIYYYRSLCFIEQYNLNGAIDDLNNVLKISNDNNLLIAAKTKLGYIFTEKNNKAKALEIFNEVIPQIKNEQLLQIVYKMQIQIYFKDSLIEQAMPILQKAVNLDGDSIVVSDLYLYYGLGLMQQKQYDAAIKAFSKSVALSNINAKAYYNRSLLYDKKGYADSSKIDWRHSVDIDGL